MSSENKKEGGRGVDIGGKWKSSEKESVWSMEGKTDQRNITRLQSSAEAPLKLTTLNACWYRYIRLCGCLQALWRD